MTAQVQTFPPWIRRAWPSGESFSTLKRMLDAGGLHTVCQSAHCPNQSECWARGTATFMVLGNLCTRHCSYCAVNSGHPEAVEDGEPEQVAETVEAMGVRHVVLTSVTRDDLPDGGANHIALCIEAIKTRLPGTTIEVLVQDFCGDTVALDRVLSAGAEVFSHNIETVARLFPRMRDQRFTYAQSLEVLRYAADSDKARYVKSSIMLGCGETDEEVTQTLRDLRGTGCGAVAMGQYLQPTPGHRKVARFVTPETFAAHETTARDMGFGFAMAGPFVRSSYRSETIFETPPGAG